MILPGQGHFTVQVLNKQQRLTFRFALKFTESILPEQTFS